MLRRVSQGLQHRLDRAAGRLAVAYHFAQLGSCRLDEAVAVGVPRVDGRGDRPGAAGGKSGGEQASQRLTLTVALVEDRRQPGGNRLSGLGADVLRILQRLLFVLLDDRLDVGGETLTLLVTLVGQHRLIRGHPAHEGESVYGEALVLEFGVLLVEFLDLAALVLDRDSVGLGDLAVAQKPEAEQLCAVQPSVDVVRQRGVTVVLRVDRVDHVDVGDRATVQQHDPLPLGVVEIVGEQLMQFDRDGLETVALGVLLEPTSAGLGHGAPQKDLDPLNLVVGQVGLASGLATTEQVRVQCVGRPMPEGRIARTYLVELQRRPVLETGYHSAGVDLATLPTHVLLHRPETVARQHQGVLGRVDRPVQIVGNVLGVEIGVVQRAVAVPRSRYTGWPGRHEGAGRLTHPVHEWRVRRLLTRAAARAACRTPGQSLRLLVAGTAGRGRRAPLLAARRPVPRLVGIDRLRRVVRRETAAAHVTPPAPGAGTGRTRRGSAACPAGVVAAPATA